MTHNYFAQFSFLLCFFLSFYLSFLRQTPSMAPHASSVGHFQRIPLFPLLISGLETKGLVATGKKNLEEGARYVETAQPLPLPYCPLGEHKERRYK